MGTGHDRNGTLLAREYRPPIPGRAGFLDRSKSYAESPAGLQVARLAEKYGVPPHEVIEWDWRTREFDSIVAAGREAYEADKQYERRQKQQKKQSKKGEADMEPPEHGFDFDDVDNRTVMTESGKRIPASMADDQNVVVVEEDEDTDSE